MKNFTRFILAALLFAFYSCNSNSAKQQESKINTLTEKEKNEGWELLFDGQSADKWKMFNGGEVSGWKIVDGELHNSGVGSDHGGDIITKNEYENFELSLEWKIAPESNSGVLYHVEEGKTRAIYESGPEYQLLDDNGWPTELEDHQYSGANYAMHVPLGAEVNPIDEWNTTRIVVNNPHVEHWLNGKKVVEYELWSDEWKELKENGKWADFPYYGASKKGHIGLQDHGGLTMFRNIKIREM